MSADKLPERQDQRNRCEVLKLFLKLLSKRPNLASEM